MKPQPHIQLSIPTPCAQDWEAMTPDAKGRFCAHCQQSVIDFTNWNDADLYGFFAKNKEHVCGRFLTTQLNRNIQLPMQKPTGFYRIAVALGLSLIFSQIPATHARTRPPLMEQNIFSLEKLPQNDTTGIDSFMIKGTVLDATKQPAINAVVNVIQNDRVIGGSVTDIDGNFEILFPHISDTTKLLIHVQYTGHDSVLIPFKQSAKPLEIFLTQADKNALYQVGGIRYIRPLVSDVHPGPNSTFTHDQIKNMP